MVREFQIFFLGTGPGFPFFPVRSIFQNFGRVPRPSSKNKKDSFDGLIGCSKDQDTVDPWFINRFERNLMNLTQIVHVT